MTDRIDENTMRVLLTALLIIAAILLRWGIVRSVRSRLKDSELVFRTSKTVSYLFTFFVFAGLMRVWIDETTDLSTVFGLVGAGLVIALGDVVRNMAGWVYIMLRDPFAIGDRVKIDEFAGDVIDVRLLRFSLIELSDWDAGQSTGRIVHVPNGLLFSHGMSNATQGFLHVWHEMDVVITFESDWERAEQLLLAALEYHSIDATETTASEELKRASQKYLIKYGILTPTVYVKVDHNGICLTGRVLVPVRQRRSINSEIWRRVLEVFGEEPSVELAYPTTRIVRSVHEQSGAGTPDAPAPPFEL